jgi:hypothetical protein
MLDIAAVVYPKRVTKASDTQTQDSRWAVIMVRLPDVPSRLDDVLPRNRPVTPAELPLVTRVTRDLDKAHTTADRLRQAGAMVVIVEEPIGRSQSAFCIDHPAQFAARTCTGCDKAICPGCIADANGLLLCAKCKAKQDLSARSIRRRQLFVLLIFVAFLYKVVEHLKFDAQQVQGNAPITIGIIQFAPRSDTGANIIRQLNRGPSEKATTPSLRDIGAWFNTEYSRYTGTPERRFRLETRGPFAIDVAPPDMSAEGTSWFGAMLKAWKYPRYFRQLALDQGVPVDDYTVKAYVVYGSGSKDIASHSRGSRKGRVAVIFVDIDETNPSYALATMAHEIGHALGARDTYDLDTNLAQNPEGYVEPFADPLYPQRYAELMSVDIPLSPKEEQEISQLFQLKVGYQTAADMGWIAPEQAEMFFTPPQVGPADKLTQDSPDDLP